MVEVRTGWTSDDEANVVGVRAYGDNGLLIHAEILRPLWVCKSRASSADQDIIKTFHNRD